MKIKDAGYTEVVEQLAPGASTFQYGGRLGSLDHIFANAAAMRMVHGAGVWDINADESIAMQYSRRNYNVTDFHTSGPWAASDHDPALVGITFPGASTPQPSGTPSVEPSASVSSQPSGEPSVSPTASLVTPSVAVSDEPSATASVTPGGASGTPAPSLTPVPSLPGGTPGTPSTTPSEASPSAHGTGTDDVSGDDAQTAVVPGGSAHLPALPATGI